MRGIAVYAITMALGMTPAIGQAQTLEERAGRMGEGTIRFSFAAREGVCGQGEGRISVDSRNREWESECEEGPVRISATVESGRVTRIRTYVGGQWRPTGGRVEELGMVGVQNATAWLESLALDHESANGDVVFPLTLADSTEPGPALIRIAKATTAPDRSRQGALFWLGQVAGAAATAHLEEVAMSEDDRKLKDAAVFGLSQLRDN